MENFEEFLNHAIERFGEGKVYASLLPINGRFVSDFNLQYGTIYTMQEVLELVHKYGPIVAVERNICPNCGKFLNFTYRPSFEHGVGFCQCGLRYRYYHYIGLTYRQYGHAPVLAYGLEGF